jgi:D-tyrosyl-tRNA(Tyr) deacylase
MRALIQRTSRASVAVDNEIVGQIGAGYLIFLGVKDTDTREDAEYLAQRVSALRIGNDAEGKMNRDLHDTGGSVLVVSQFTLHADTRKGNRPSYIRAAQPELAEELYRIFTSRLEVLLGEGRVATGTFRASMDVELVNDGPVTVMLYSKSEYNIDNPLVP